MTTTTAQSTTQATPSIKHRSPRQPAASRLVEPAPIVVLVDEAYELGITGPRSGGRRRRGDRVFDRRLRRLLRHHLRAVRVAFLQEPANANHDDDHVDGVDTIDRGHDGERTFPLTPSGAAPNRAGDLS